VRFVAALAPSTIGAADWIVDRMRGLSEGLRPFWVLVGAGLLGVEVGWLVGGLVAGQAAGEAHVPSACSS
jgi:hypothetical protein